ncbi:MAG TPA: sigma-70 family RNA polymerase sigma factor [Pseudomonas sp.]|uniref:sigma-70 family RNA polymerase sigma factor n=1 Tax=Pseudomonas sp. TaxID=306 RepID=UPI002B4A2FFD|nr:sigma-70 family RNA polymerase sigma factor [Pseudomonas sp.]HKS14395.1 sigma-70 family RNA polymerase sigma factor [Pseudomonas sp.]
MPEHCFDHQACLQACARGERQALRDLYQEDSARLLGIARRIARDDGLAQDIVHDAFIKIWHGAGSFDPARGSARGWIYSVTRHLALNHVRNSAREVLVGEHEDVVDPEADPAQAFNGHSDRIHLCLEQLQPARRSCIVHAYVDGYTHAQIAEKLGTPLGTVKAWIKRSLVALRECMG